MRILMLSDIHGNLNEIQAVVYDADSKGLHYDSILQLGDFGVWPGDAGKRFLDGVSALAVGLDKPFRFIGGNHDDYDQINQWTPTASPFIEVRENLSYIRRGARWTWGPRTFGALGGAFSVDYPVRTPHRSWWPGDEEVHVEDVQLLGPQHLDVLVTHTTGVTSSPKRQPAFLASGACLRLSADTEFRADLSEQLTQYAIDHTQPQWVFHGHWHCVNMFEQRYVGSDRISNILGFECLDTRGGQMVGDPESCYAIYDTSDASVTFRGNVL